MWFTRDSLEERLEDERAPMVAGNYYPADADLLRQQVHSLVAAPAHATWQAPVVIAPYAHYDLVGDLLGKLYGAVTLPEVVVLLSPAEVRLRRISQISSYRPWRIPGGSVAIASDVAESLRDVGLLSESPGAFDDECAIETQLPFLTTLNARVRIVPVRLGNLPWPTCVRLAQSLSDLAAQYRRRLLIIGLTNLHRHSDSAFVRRQDTFLSELIAQVDSKAVYHLGARPKEAPAGLCAAAIALHTAELLDAISAYQHGYRLTPASRSKPAMGYGAWSFRERITERIEALTSSESSAEY